MRIVAYLMTCPERAEVLEKTLASFRATDWPCDPRTVVDWAKGSDRKLRQTRTAYRLLKRARREPWDYLLFLEDDLQFNRFLYHNLTAWHPVRYEYARIATLYSTATKGLVAGQHSFCYRADQHGGSQALLIHRSMLDLILASWSSFNTEMQDLRIAGPISRVDPLIHVFTPNLVQHRQVESTWDGQVHTSTTFDQDFQIPTGDEMIHFKFYHGLGDTANAAHLFALYRKLGHEIAVECSPDKAPLFQAAGCEIAGSAPAAHGWDHPPGGGSPDLTNHWLGNKAAWNISRGVLPNIGSQAERWDDLCAVRLDLDPLVPEAVRDEVTAYMDRLPRPVIALHTKGNTSPGNKNYPDDQHHDLYRGILDRLGGTVLILDWDSRVPWFHHYGVRHLKGDWKGHLTTLELYEVLRQADCLVGVDSGVLHFGRFTDTPAVGVWSYHYPSHFALPRINTVHVLGDRHSDWTRRRRLAFGLLEVPGDVPASWEVAETVARVIRPRKLLEQAGPDVLLQHLLDRCRTTDGDGYRDRHRTFEAFLTLLKGVQRPVVVETGCIRAEEDFSAGYSSYIFGHFLRHHGGELQSVDIDRANCNFARTWTVGLPVQVFESDSRPWLSKYTGTIDGLYLDSADVGTPRYQEICLEEAQAALPKLAPHAPILIDDTPYQGQGVFGGKGGLAVPWLISQGWKINQAGYQVLLVR